MTSSSSPHGKRSGRLWWTLGIAVAVLLVVLSAVVVWLSNALQPPQEEPVTAEEVTALEERLRSKDSAEDTLTHYEALLAQTADQVAALVPGLTWRWNREDTTISCAGPLADTRGVQVLTRHALFDGPIPDEAWPHAFAIVRSQAATLGATDVFTYKDGPGDHDVAISGDDGVEIRFGTRIAATLSARSDCRLKQADLESVSRESR